MDGMFQTPNGIKLLDAYNGNSRCGAYSLTRDEPEKELILSFLVLVTPSVKSLLEAGGWNPKLEPRGYARFEDWPGSACEFRMVPEDLFKPNLFNDLI